MPNNSVAGVKRKSEELELDPRVKAAGSERTNSLHRSVAPSGRFQLSNNASNKSSATSRTNPHPDKPRANSGFDLSLKGPSGQTTSPASTQANRAPAKRGFASILERAKAAQEAAKAAGPSTIRHKPAAKMSRRERLRMEEQQKAEHKKGGKSATPNGGRSQSNTPLADKHATTKRSAPEISYKGTMKSAPAPLPYKGTMHAAGSKRSEDKGKKQKGPVQDRYGGYASWSDLDDVEDEEDEMYESESDMEGGFDEVEEEENQALRKARKEDQAEREEEERLKREKLERKKRLEQLSKSTASKKKL